MKRPDPVSDPNDDARILAQSLLRLSHAALAFTDPQTQAPGISRIAFGLDKAGDPVTLISALSSHYAALLAHPDCAVLLGSVGARGDPLTHPRLSIRARAQFVSPDDPARADLRAHWLKGHPKAALYVDFTDFAFVRLHPVSAFLNGGFAKAFRLSPGDLRP